MMRSLVIGALVTLAASAAVAQTQLFRCPERIRVEDVWPQQIAALANGDRKVEITFSPRDRRFNPLEASVIRPASPWIKDDGIYCRYYGPGVSATYRWQGDGHLVHCYSKPAVTPEIQWPKDVRGAQFVEASQPRTMTEDPERNVCIYSQRGEYGAVYRFAIDTKSHQCRFPERMSIDPVVICRK